jgi:signal transduction histidine kinase
VGSVLADITSPERRSAGEPPAFVEPHSDPLVEALRAVAAARSLPDVMAAVRRSARRLLEADGATFVLREGGLVHYADEDAISPLWKGRRFPIEACASGWAILRRVPVVVEDVFDDPRVPADAYRPTFVKSMVLVPIRREDPLGAVGAYWAEHRRATPRQVATLEALADLAAVAVANAALLAEMRRAVELRDEFMALAAHELNTPLAVVRLRADALLRAAARAGEAPPPELEPLQAAVGRLAGAVNGLLDFSRASRDGFVLQRAPVDLAEVAAAAVSDLRGRAVATETPVRLAAPTPVRGEWDGPRLRQAVGGVIENALKFGRGLPVEVEVQDAPEEGRVVVRDRGPGVAREDRERIFGKFERAASANHVGGLGLGLWMARSIAEAHGGTLALDGGPGAGATFVLTVPKRLPRAR